LQLPTPFTGQSAIGALALHGCFGILLLIAGIADKNRRSLG
jgi:hypothetical protein